MSYHFILWKFLVVPVPVELQGILRPIWEQRKRHVCYNKRGCPSRFRHKGRSPTIWVNWLTRSEKKPSADSKKWNKTCSQRSDNNNCKKKFYRSDGQR